MTVDEPERLVDDDQQATLPVADGGGVRAGDGREHLLVSRVWLALFAIRGGEANRPRVRDGRW